MLLAPFVFHIDSTAICDVTGTKQHNGAEPLIWALQNSQQFISEASYRQETRLATVIMVKTRKYHKLKNISKHITQHQLSSLCTNISMVPL